jgi:hypothetical protein
MGLTLIAPTPTATLLLARQMDDEILNPLHAFVRNRLRYSPPQAEMAQPAPGPKNPIQITAWAPLHSLPRPSNEG